MKNATLLKIASLFIFLLSAQFSFGQTILTNDDFSQDAGTWTSGGNYATFYDLDDIGEYSFTYSCTNLSDNVFLLRNDNGAASSIISQTYDLSGYDSVAFEYDYAVFEMNNPGDDWFLEFSDNNGATWQTAKHYDRTQDYYSGHCGVWGSNSKEVVTLQSSDYTFNSTNKFRLRAQDVPGDTNNRGFLFVDNIVVAGYANISLNDIFHEDFEDDTDSGNNSSDFSGNDEINNIPWIADKQGYAEKWKISGGKWEGKRVLSASSLTTDPFSISGYQALQFEFDVQFSNVTSNQTNKLRVFYTIDSGPEQLLVQYMAQNPSQIYTVNLPSTTTGNNIILRIEMLHKSGNNHKKCEYKIDYIKLRGYDPNYIGPEDLFYEDFSGYPNDIEISNSVDSITGTGTSTTNPNGVSWSLTGPESANEIKLHHDGGQGDSGHIHTKKVNGTATFETDPITVSGYTDLNLKIYVDKLEKLDNNDTIELGYDLDGLGYTIIETITGYGDFTVNGNKVEDVTIDSDIIAIGDSIVIYIKITHNNNWDEKFEWDDITLTGTPFYNVWQGTESDLVTNTAKWSKGSQPTEASNVWIPNTKHLKLTDDQAYNTVNARATSQLTIEKTGSLTTVGDFTKIAGTGAVTLNSDSNEFASIIVGGTATGNITYNKHVNYQAYEEWDLVGPPVLNQNMKTFAQTNTNNNSTSGAMAMGGDYYALGQYYTGWGSWGNYTTLTIPDANFPVAKGYQMATNAIENNSSLEGQSLTFTGEIATTTQTINIQNQNGANGGYGRRWNLVANPFPSYLNGNTNAGAQNFIDINEGVIDSSYLAIYAWKADATDGTGWHTFNRLNTNNDDGTLFIAPGQAFFVAAASTDVAQIQFTPSMRTVTGGDDFINGAPVLLNYKLDLKLFNGSAERAKTKFHFQQGLTLGLNPGYDAGAYNQGAALSSRLPEDDQGVNFQLNAMSIEAAYNQTIPLVINQQEGQSFRISISNNTLPEDVNVYLEDVFNGTLTSLKDQDFELVAQEDLSQDGRFYIRFTTESLAVNDVLSPSSITVFKLNTDNFITIKGLSPEMGKTTATLYNMLGMKVRSKTLNTYQSAQRISTQGLASGVYIINLKAGDQAVSKKVIIQ